MPMNVNHRRGAAIVALIAGVIISALTAKSPDVSADTGEDLIQSRPVSLESSTQTGRRAPSAASVEKKMRVCAPLGVEMGQVLGLEIDRQTTAIVAFKRTGAIREISYGCPMGADGDPGSMYVSWDGGVQPPRRVMALITAAAQQLTAGDPGEVQKTVTDCLQDAARSDLSQDVEAGTTSVSCSVSNDASVLSGTVSISRSRSQSEE